MSVIPGSKYKEACERVRLAVLDSRSFIWPGSAPLEKVAACYLCSGRGGGQGVQVKVPGKDGVSTYGVHERCYESVVAQRDPALGGSGLN
jgi:hypothetical protein